MYFCTNSDGLAFGGPIRGGAYTANAWGLYDMHGNVWEWCRDRNGSYPGGEVTDPQGSTTGSYRMIRGGGWTSMAYTCRSANRAYYGPTTRYNYIGFRLVLAQVPQ